MVKSGGRRFHQCPTRCPGSLGEQVCGNSGLLSQDVQVELFQPRIPDVRLLIFRKTNEQGSG